MTSTTVRPDAAPELRRMHHLALLAALAAVMVPVMSFMSINVALGEIGSDLGASPGMLQLVVAAYGVVYAALVVIGGRLGDGYGRKRLLVIGLSAFALTSLLCSLAQSPTELVGARLLQGVSAALVAPQVLASLHANNDGHHRDRAIALFGATAGVATAVAFLLGGSLAGSDLGWRSIFWINAPIIALVLVGVVRYLPESKAPSRSSLDWTGAALLGITMALLILPLTEGRALGWPTWTWVCLALFVVAAAVLVWWQRRLESRGRLPLVPPSLFAFRSVSIGLGVGLPVYITFGGFMFVYAVMAGVRHMDPLQIGVTMIPMAVAFLVTSVTSGRLVPRFGSTVLLVGSLIGAVGVAWLAYAVGQVSGALSLGDVVGPMVVFGAGLGVVWSPLMGIVLSQVPHHLAGLGGGLVITAMQAGIGLGSAVVGAVYFGWDGDFTRTGYVLGVVMVLVALLTLTLPRRSRV
ncbi:MAG: MFS transporter [Nocardioides sp.]|nr:MFS transporter [Nocardioides sp.]